MKSLYKYILLISLNLLSQNVVLEVDTSILRIGEQFNVTLKIYDAQPNSVIFPEFQNLFDNLELIDNALPVLNLENDTFLSTNFILTSFDTGKFVIKPIPIVFSQGDSIFSNSLSVHFLSTTLDTTNKFFDIKPPKKVPFLAKELLFYMPYLLGFLLLLICIGLLWKYFQKKKNKQLIVKTPTIPIDIYFINKLDDLLSKNYLKHQKYKYFYTDLSEIFRGYLELRFSVPALESSTHDLKLSLEDLKINKEWINPFLRTSDIVKFAKGFSSEKDGLSFLDNVRSFIVEFGESDLIDNEQDDTPKLNKD